MGSQERNELVRRLFALMTAKLEDGAAEAVEGQAADQDIARHIACAHRIELIARDVGVLAESAAAILRD